MNDVPLIAQVVMYGCMLASGGLWTFLAKRWSASSIILPAVPRTAVPWGAGGTVFALFFLMNACLNAAVPDARADQAAIETTSSSDSATAYAAKAAIMSLAFLTTAVAGLALLHRYRKATAIDLGLPTSWEVARKDIGLGLATFLAILGPVMLIQIVVVNLLQMPAEHPTIMRVMADPSPLIWIVSIFGAVVVAPLFEEFAFRLLLQGWLEKSEERTLLTLEAVEREEDEFREFSDQDASEDSTNRESDSLSDTSPQHVQLPDPERVSLLGLPLGWPSILTSALIFGLAHIGQGPAPIALFVFGIGVGYVYQQTHRILPCVIAHMAFNGFMMFILYLSL